MVFFEKLHPDAVIPNKGTTGSAAYDLYPVVQSKDDFGNVGYKLGFATAFPESHVALVFNRSSIVKKPSPFGLRNAVAVIDSDYRGEWVLKFHQPTINLYEATYSVDKDKPVAIAQVIFVPKSDVEFVEVLTGELPNSTRGTGGFGSTGI